MKWTFEQITGPADKRMKLELTGWAAPFGRPRRDPVVKEVIKSRIQTTLYPGSEQQTRSAFGVNWEDTELRGRWMTKDLQQLGMTANDMANAWVQFIKGERTVRISWGTIISWTGYVTELELGRESENEIAWRIKLSIDGRSDDITKRQGSGLATDPPRDVIPKIGFLRAGYDLNGLEIPDISPDFFDQLNNLAAQLNAPAALMFKIANEVDAAEQATYATLQHFRGAITGFRAALDVFANTVSDAEIDAVLITRSILNDARWVVFQTTIDWYTYQLMDLLNLLDRQAEIRQKTVADRFVKAVDGDTWESISTRATGGPNKANAIRQLNGIRYGERPEPGVSYLVQSG